MNSAYCPSAYHSMISSFVHDLSPSRSKSGFCESVYKIDELSLIQIELTFDAVVNESDLACESIAAQDHVVWSP